jgi:hypothetical protein
MHVEWRGMDSTVFQHDWMSAISRYIGCGLISLMFCMTVLCAVVSRTPT